MALSLTPLSSFRFSPIKTHQSAYPRKQPDTTFNLKGKLPCLYNCSISQSSYGLHHHKGGFRLASVDSYLPKAFQKKGSTQLGEAECDSPVKKPLSLIKAIWLFMRLHPAIAVTIQFVFVLARTWKENAHQVIWSPWPMLIKTVAAYVAIQFAHGFSNGINQVFDIEIDKINKPHLPLASGVMSVEYAWLLLLFFLGIGIPSALLIRSYPFLLAMGIIIILAFAYSCPPLRLKCSTFGAIISIGLTQGILSLFSTHGSASDILGLPFQLSSPGIYMFVFGSVFALAMGFLKDIPDYEGDVKNGVPTLAAKVGLKETSFLGAAMVVMNYIGGIVAAIYMPQAFKRSIVIPSHIVQALSLIFQVWKMEKMNYVKEERLNFHKLLFLLFHLEYLIYLLM